MTLLFAVTLSGCAASGSLHEWAFEKAPRSEVLGFVEGHDGSDALLVRIRGEELGPDGIYEMIVTSETHGDVVGAVAPRKLDRREVEELLELREQRSRSARLDAARASWPASWERVDAYEHRAEGLHRIDDSGRAYFVSVAVRHGEQDEASARTPVVVHVRGPDGRRAERIGVAQLPPARRETSRMILGAIVAPVAVAFDVVTLPVQAVVFPIMVGRALDKLMGQSFVMADGFGPTLSLGIQLAPVLIFAVQSNPTLVRHFYTRIQAPGFSARSSE